MKHTKIILFLLFSLFLWTGCLKESKPSSAALENLPYYQVIKVIDGDTIKVNYNGRHETIRLLQIDTPESNHADEEKNVPMGKTAAAFTKDLIGDRDVQLVFDKEQRDKYDRLLCYVYVDGKCINEELIKAGMAMVFKREPNTAKYKEFKALEKEARKNGIGIWQDIAANYPGKDIDKEYLKDSPKKTQAPSDAEKSESESKKGKIKGNRKSKVYHLPDSPDYDNISEANVIYFESESDARSAGYKKANVKK